MCAQRLLQSTAGWHVSSPVASGMRTGSGLARVDVAPGKAPLLLRSYDNLQGQGAPTFHPCARQPLPTTQRARRDRLVGRKTQTPGGGGSRDEMPALGSSEKLGFHPSGCTADSLQKKACAQQQDAQAKNGIPKPPHIVTTAILIQCCLRRRRAARSAGPWRSPHHRC